MTRNCATIPLFSEAMQASIYRLGLDKYRSTWLGVLNSDMLAVAMTSSFVSRFVASTLEKSWPKKGFLTRQRDKLGRVILVFTNDHIQDHVQENSFVIGNSLCQLDIWSKGVSTMKKGINFDSITILNNKDVVK